MLAITDEGRGAEPTNVRLVDQYEDEHRGFGLGIRRVQVEEYECEYRGRPVALALVDDGRGLGYVLHTVLPPGQQRELGDWFLAWKGRAA